MRAEKQLLLGMIKEGVEKSNAMIVMSYDAVNPNIAEDFRASLHEKGATMVAVPKRVFVKAASEAGLTFEKGTLKGHIALVLAGEDIIGPAKAVYAFNKENGDKLQVLAGHFEGKLCPAETIAAISKLPSQDEMRAQLLGVLQAPFAGMVSACQAVLSGVVSCVAQKAEKEN